MQSKKELKEKSSKNKKRRIAIIEPHDNKRIVATFDPQEVATALLKNLHNSLEQFLLHFIKIDLNNIERNNDTHILVEQLIAFISELVDNLEKIPLNSDKIEEFRQKLLLHIGKKRTIRLFKQNVPPCRIELDDVHSILKELLDSDPGGLTAKFKSKLGNLVKKDSYQDVIKNQIAVNDHLCAKLQHFPVNRIADYCIFTKLMDKQHETIKKIREEMQRNIESLAASLKKELQFYGEEFLNRPERINGNHSLSELENIQDYLVKIENEYLQKKSICNSLHENPTQEELKQYIEYLDNMTIIQKNLLNELNDLQGFYNHQDGTKKMALSNIEKLNREYFSIKNELGQHLQQTLNDAKATLLIYPENADDPIVSEKKILTNELRTRNQTKSLTALKREVTLAIHVLNEHIAQTRVRLRADYQNSIRRINDKHGNFLFQPFFSSLSQENPFKDEINRAYNRETQEVAKLQTLYQSINTVPPMRLAQIVPDLNEAIRLTGDEILIQREELCEKAGIIEIRLRSPHYLTSLRIIKKLENEYIRIINAHIDEAIEKFPAKKDRLNGIKTNPASFLAAHTPPDMELLNTIDPRLNKLLSISYQFKQTNTEYINTNLHAMNNERYLNHLIKHVETHIHNNHMEDLSEGIRSPFIQWIRKSVLKPLQNLKHQIIEKKSPHRFFTTLGACKTEKELVETGNQVYKSLVDSSPQRPKNMPKIIIKPR
ncbi:hypothetical protein [Legionella fairfieldensis]|uniref:hypothetical protein n=1 Tax=Legionella fairfieldensis TaxID=45064 RepID=UPI0004915A1D|nr:hypothetical protein [Legionella fairfieldensis]